MSILVSIIGKQFSTFNAWEYFESCVTKERDPTLEFYN